MTSPHSNPAARRSLLACLGVAAALQLVVVNHWRGFASPNERARAYQAIAIASRGSLAIDAEVGRFGEMEDTAAVGGRLYPNKAPGATVLIVPGALVAHAISGGGESELAWTLVLGRLLACSLPFLLTAALIARLVERTDPNGGLIAATAYALATPALASSLLLFSHALAAFLLLAAFELLFGNRALGPGGAISLSRAAAAGLAISWAVTAEYPVLVPGAVLAVLAVPRLRLRGALALAAGGAAPALALAAYNQACFGSPLALSSGHEAHAAYVALASHGLFGVGAPTLSGVLGLLFSPSRGLLVWAPLVALAAAGLRRREAGDGAERAALALVPFSLLLAMSGYPNWHGGWFPGPRYLLAVLPFVFVLVGRGAATATGAAIGRVLIAAALLWGAANAWLSISAFPFPPEDYPLPALTFSLPLLRDGVLVPSWLPPPGEAAVIAALAVGAVVLLLCAAAGGRPGRESAAAVALAAFALAVVTLVTPRPNFWQARLEWAVVLDLYAGETRRGALEALAPECVTIEQRAQLQRWIATRDLERE